MIQRIQSIYLLLAAVVTGILIHLFSLYTLNGEVLTVMDDMTFLIMSVLSTLISLFSIFRYRNRQQQVVAGRLNVILNFVLFGFILFTFYSNQGEGVSTLGVSAFMPIAAVILITMANRAIMKDEALVRAADRLR